MELESTKIVRNFLQTKIVTGFALGYAANMISDKVKQIADGLQKWSGLSWLGVSEVLAWEQEGQERLGLRGKAQTIQSRLFGETMGMIPNRRHSLDVGLQRAMGVDAGRGNSYGVTGPVGQTLDEPECHVSQVFEAISTIATDDYNLASLLPSEGEPWVPSEEITYYNAKTKKWKKSKPPVGIQLLNGEHVVNICIHAPHVDASGPVVAATSHRSKPLRLLATHCMPIHDTATTKLIAQCGGLIFPSIAVGEIPATTFGPLCFAFSFSVVLQGIKPYRSRGNWPIIVYDSDAWTMSMSEILTQGQRMLYEQLTGQFVPNIYNSSHHMWVLGSPQRDSGFMNVDMKVVDSTKKLASRAHQLASLWKRDVDVTKMERLSDDPKNRYPYMEAKSSSVIMVSCAPIVVCPKFLLAQTKKFLQAIGWNGRLLTVDVPKEWQKTLAGTGSTDDMVYYQYAWMVRDAILRESEPEYLR